LLNMVRIEDFASDFRVERVDLVALVRRLVNDHKRDFILHGVYPRLELPAGGAGDDSYWVESDAKWLRFVLEQIVTNAIKYSARPGGGGRVTFQIDRYDSGIQLSVS